MSSVSRFVVLAVGCLVLLVACDSPVDPPGRVAVRISPASATESDVVSVVLENGSDRNLTIGECGGTLWERHVGDTWEVTELGVMPFCNNASGLGVQPDDDWNVVYTVPPALSPGEYRLVWSVYSSFAPGDGFFNVTSNTFVVTGTQ